MKIIQGLQVETNDIQRRINQTIHLQQTREEVQLKSQAIEDKIKKFFDKKSKEDDFYIGDKVLKWDSRREEKGKHGKFDFLWKGPYVIYGYIGNNAFFLKEMDGSDLLGGPVNDRMLKHYYSSEITNIQFCLLCPLYITLKILDWIGCFPNKFEAWREGPKLSKVKYHKYE